MNSPELHVGKLSGQELTHLAGLTFTASFDAYENPEFKKVTEMGGRTLVASPNSMCTVGCKLWKSWARLCQLCSNLGWESASLYQTTNSTQGEIFHSWEKKLATLLPCSLCCVWSRHETGTVSAGCRLLQKLESHRTALLLGRVLWDKAGPGCAFLKLSSIGTLIRGLLQPAYYFVFCKGYSTF